MFKKFITVTAIAGALVSAAFSANAQTRGGFHPRFNYRSTYGQRFNPGPGPAQILLDLSVVAASNALIGNPDWVVAEGFPQSCVQYTYGRCTLAQVVGVNRFGATHTFVVQVP